MEQFAVWRGFSSAGILVCRWSWNQAEKESVERVPQARKVYKSQKLVDNPRKAVSIWTSGKYGVIADELSRLLLIDIEQGVVLKMWKG